MLNIEDLNEKAIHCSLREEVKPIMNILHNNGYKWCSGDSLLEGNNHWSRNKERTIYHVGSDHLISYGSIKSAELWGYTVVTAKEVLQMQAITPDELYEQLLLKEE